LLPSTRIYGGGQLGFTIKIKLIASKVIHSLQKIPDTRIIAGFA
jgi:hypothetical protein